MRRRVLFVSFGIALLFNGSVFAQTLGGQLLFESKPGQGCTAILELPDMQHARS